MRTKKKAPAKKAKPKATPKKKVKSSLTETPISVRVYREQKATLKEVSRKRKVPVGKIIRELTFKYLPIEYPTKAA